jgi:hypothetical protein
MPAFQPSDVTTLDVAVESCDAVLEFEGVEHAGSFETIGCQPSVGVS